MCPPHLICRVYHSCWEQCGLLWYIVAVSVRVAARIPDALAERIALRATAETRTLSNMIERLLELGLGVVTDGSVLCSMAAFHATTTCSECGWKPTVVSTAPAVAVASAPVAAVPVREVREHGWRGPDPKVKR